MDKPNDGGPAFPCTDAKGFVSDGMSLRDWFAGQALAGDSSQEDHRRYDKECGLTLEQWREQCFASDAEFCYALADAMLAERDKERK